MEITTIITALLASQLKTTLISIVKEFGENVSHFFSNNLLEYQLEEYNRNLYSKTIIHRTHPKQLDEFYQPLYINEIGEKKHYKTTLDGEKRISTDSIKKLFTNQQFITLIGSAGSGKSTMVKYLFVNSIRTNFKIPIKIELRYLNEYDKSIIEYVQEKIFKVNMLESNEKIIEKLMKSGKFVFFLDGYDEIAVGRKERITKEIDDLVKLYGKNCYLLTSRPYTDIEFLPLFHNFDVCELNETEIKQFIVKQIPPNESEFIEKIIKAIDSPENSSYKSFLRNPLLLSMFILTFQSYSSIPEKRSIFYSQVFDALFSVHDSMSKLAFVREKQCGLSKDHIIEVLEIFSFISFFEEKFTFTGHYLNEKLEQIKIKKKHLVFNNENIISDLQVAIGIINKDGTEYTFPHRSLQEFFAALYISSLNEDNKSIIYKKITSAFSGDRRIVVNNKANFNLLLSELDEIGVINYVIIPLLNKFIVDLDSISADHNSIIDEYLYLQSIYSSFHSILNEPSIFKVEEIISQKFGNHIRSFEKKFSSKINVDEIRSSALDELASKDIMPFLIKYKPKVVQKYLS